MNKHIKFILIVVGIALSFYGINMLIAIEASINIRSLDMQAQYNMNAYIIIGLGLASLLVSLMARKKV